jgi:RNA recognition motif-containing protein
MKIYAGNLSYTMEENELREEFERFGEVSDAAVIRDRDTGRHRGFGFVTMPDDAAAQSAISALHDREVGGRRLVVNEAKPKPAGAGGRGSSRGGYRRNEDW